MTVTVSIHTFSRLMRPARNSKTCSIRKLTCRPLPGTPARLPVTSPCTVEGQLRPATARVHLQWLDRLGEQRFAALWSALQEVTGRDDPLPDPTELAHQAG